jgi:hypothetical protein
MLFRHALGGRLISLVALLLLCACSPTLDWREVRPEGARVVALFPCKPSNDARMVTLDGVRVRMVLLACQAGDTTWALVMADMADPQRVASALVALREASAANLGAPPQVLGPMTLSGMPPNAQSQRVRFSGKLPGGEPKTMETGFFADGTWVFQATAMGARLSREAVDTFFDSLKLAP